MFITTVFLDFSAATSVGISEAYAPISRFLKFRKTEISLFSVNLYGIAKLYRYKNYIVYIYFSWVPKKMCLVCKYKVQPS